jgi:GR25 family glycosyltransferase involved in LPS biosynthesis
MMQCHVINLQTRPDRLRNFQAANPGFAFERFDAVNGAAYSRDAAIRDGLITADNEYTDAAIGCALSHVSLWRHAVASGRPVCVLEDDVLVRDDFAAAATAMLAGLARWDVVFWTWNLDWPLCFLPGEGQARAWLQTDPYAIRGRYDAFKADTRPALLARLISLAAAACYVVSPEGAARLLRRCLPIGRVPGDLYNDGSTAIAWINGGIDVEMSRHLAALDAYVAIPPLAVAINDLATSSIRGLHVAGER